MTTATHLVPGHPVIVRTVVLPDDVAEMSLLSMLPKSSSVMTWVHDAPNADTGLIGWGESARCEVSGRERFSRAQRWWVDWLADADVEDAVRLPGSGPIAFASFAFDPNPGSSVVIVPATIIGRRNGVTWITVTAENSRDVRRMIDETITSLRQPSSVPAAPQDLAYSDGSQSISAWRHAVTESVRRIDDGELDKVVLARDVVATSKTAIDSRYVLRQLASRYPTCWTFSVDGLIGATPEMLVRRVGDTVTSRVLAGTVRRSADATSDASLAESLLDSAKDHAEHAYAVQSVAHALSAHCTDLDVPASPRLLRLANVQHLVTDVTGVLADGAAVLGLAASLHPTAAVCGTPTERALGLIRELEGMDRGRYAGPVGWMDARGDGEFGIALRCAKIENDHQLRLFAGCGLVSGSTADAELAESAAKLVPMRDALETP
ncbi:MAG: isochorismate synthase [Actinomycetes bacterium]|jgi:menaquinone-specific isochorismate synthase